MGTYSFLVRLTTQVKTRRGTLHTVTADLPISLTVPDGTTASLAPPPGTRSIFTAADPTPPPDRNLSVMALARHGVHDPVGLAEQYSPERVADVVYYATHREVPTRKVAAFIATCLRKGWNVPQQFRVSGRKEAGE